jgi:nitrile hydratase
VSLGPHDLGGAPGYGAVRPEPNEPVFHADWERRVLGMVLAVSHWRRWT